MKVKVWNKNVHTYKEKFRDEMIIIPAGKFIWMEEDQAHIFKGTMGAAPLCDADGNKIPEGFKMITVEKVPGGETESGVEMTKNVAGEYDENDFSPQALNTTGGVQAVREKGSFGTTTSGAYTK